MDSTEMGRLAAWLTRQSPKRLGYIGKLRWAGMPEKHLGPIAWAIYRRQHGLECRAVLALVMAPEVLHEACDGLELRQILTPPYAALVSMLLNAETPASVRDRARADLAAHARNSLCRIGRSWRPQRDSNPCYRRERAVS